MHNTFKETQLSSPCCKLPVVVDVVGVEFVAQVDSWLSNKVLITQPTQAACGCGAQQTSKACQRRAWSSGLCVNANNART